MPFRMGSLSPTVESIDRFTTTSTIAFAFLLLHLPREAYSNSGWSFLPNQQHCRLTCLNGGVCAYEVREPSNHKCICFIGMWSGEQCEIPVGSEEEGAAATVTESSATTDSVESVDGSPTEERPLYQLPDTINSGSVGHQQSGGDGGGEVRESEVRQHPVHHVHEADGEDLIDIAPNVSTTDEPKTTVLNEEETFETIASPTEDSDDDEEGVTTVAEDILPSSTLATIAGSSEEEEKEELDVAEETASRQSAARDGVILLGGNGVASNGRVGSAEYIGAPYTSTVVQYENKRTSTTQRMGEVEEVTTSSVSWRGQDDPPAPAGGGPYHQPPPRPKKKKKSKGKSVNQANADSTANSPSPPSPPRYDTGHSWMTAKSARGAGSHAPNSAVALMTHRLFGTGGVLFAIALLFNLIRH